MKGIISEFNRNGEIKKKINVDFFFATGNNSELCICLPDKSTDRFQELTIPLKKLISQMNKQFNSELEIEDLYDRTAEAL